MENERGTLKPVAQLIERGSPDAQRTKRIAEFIRSARGYCWVGIYEVTDSEMIAICLSKTQPAEKQSAGPPSSQLRKRTHQTKSSKCELRLEVGQRPRRQAFPNRKESVSSHE